MSEKKRAEFVAIGLRELVSSWGESRLPSRTTLARRLKVSPNTLARAIQILEEEGLLVTSPRSGTYLAAKVPVVIEEEQLGVAARSADRVYGALISDIEHGLIRKGSRMPKVAWLARHLGAGTDSVKAAYGRMAREGLIQRQGRGYTFGPWKKTNILTSRLPDRSILLIQMKQREWVSLADHERLHSFYYAFMQEALSFQVRVIPCTAYPSEERANPAFSSGKDAIEAILMKEQGSLLGILLLGRPMLPEPWSRKFLPWLVWACRQGKPVVWFDMHNSAGSFELPGPVTSAYLDFIRAPAARRIITRCHHDDMAAVRLALETLYASGHRHITFPNPFPEHDSWVDSRAKLLHWAALKIDKSIIVSQVKIPESLIGADPTSTIERLFSSLVSDRDGLARKIAYRIAGYHGPTTRLQDLKGKQSVLVRVALVLAAAIADGNPTAVVAPNDHMARLFLDCLTLAGIRVPRDISLVSFDANPVAMYPYSVSSIDFGYDYLGFQALHQLLGDRHVPLGAHRSLAGLCRLTHHGTIGRSEQNSKESAEGSSLEERDSCEFCSDSGGTRIPPKKSTG